MTGAHTTKEAILKGTNVMFDLPSSNPKLLEHLPDPDTDPVAKFVLQIMANTLENRGGFDNVLATTILNNMHPNLLQQAYVLADRFRDHVREEQMPAPGKSSGSGTNGASNRTKSMAPPPAESSSRKTPEPKRAKKAEPARRPSAAAGSKRPVMAVESEEDSD